MLSSRLCLNSLSFWNTKATRSMSSACGMDRTSTPPTSTRPALASQKRGTSEAAVVLPPPEGPHERHRGARGHVQHDVLERGRVGARIRRT
mgnify:CR=1 FL=1